MFWDQKQKPGDPSALERLADEYEAAPVETVHGVGTLLGAIGVVVLRIVAR